MVETSQARADLIQSQKFEKVFGSIEKQILMQSSFLESIYNIQTQRLDMEKDRLREEKERLAALSAQGTEDKLGDNTTSGKGSDVTATDKDKENFMSGLIPGLSTFLGSLFGTGGGLGIRGLGSKVFGAGAMALLAPAIGDFIAGFAKAALDDFLPNTSDFNQSFSDALGKGGAWAAVGSIFGKRAALIFGLAGFTSSLADELFGTLDSNKDGVISAFGLEITEDMFSKIGAAVGGAIGLALPGILSSGLGPVFATLIGPVGLTAAAAAALLGGVALFDEWMDDKRNELIDDINAQLRDGLDRFKAEKDRSLFSKIWTGIVGADGEDDFGAQLQALESQIQSERIRQSGTGAEFGEINDLDISQIEDTDLRDRLAATRDTLGATLSQTELEGFSQDKLEQLDRITFQLGLIDENRKVREQLNAVIENAARVERETRETQAAEMQAAAEELSGASWSQLIAMGATGVPLIEKPAEAEVKLSPYEAADLDNRSDAMLIERIQKLQSGSQQPVVVPIPVPTPSAPAAGPTQVDQSTHSSTVTIFPGRSKYEELDTFTLVAP